MEVYLGGYVPLLLIYARFGLGPFCSGMSVMEGLGGGESKNEGEDEKKKERRVRHPHTTFSDEGDMRYLEDFQSSIEV